MNIQEAKNYIKDSIRMYLKKNEFGEYRVPVVRQRPIFLLGAPGIGKTAIMEQIAQELSIALVSYSMTHHTRQSALGLPFIEKKEYGGKEYAISEYTMSEIIASIYETMEESGVNEGILFLDEINCVSETLAPSMLQFLQYKTFGRHSVPEGWVIVTAGNPPEFNKSVREFDVVTMDRLKLIEVEADLKTWKNYATERGIHPAITNYLDIKKEHFYLMEMTTKGRNYVTARGWEDLSQILYLYEEEGKQAEESLIEQYIRNDKVVREFAAYYELYNKYKRDYRIEEILTGEYNKESTERAGNAKFDERLSLMGMLLDRVQNDIKEVMEEAGYLKELRAPLASLKGNDDDVIQTNLATLLDARRKLIETKSRAGALSDSERKKHLRIARFFEEALKAVNNGTGDKFGIVKNKYDGNVNGLKETSAKVKAELHNLFAFVEEAFGNDNEMLILMTELTVHTKSSQFIATFGSEDYSKHNKELMLTERSADLKEEIAALNLE